MDEVAAWAWALRNAAVPPTVTVAAMIEGFMLDYFIRADAPEPLSEWGAAIVPDDLRDEYRMLLGEIDAASDAARERYASSYGSRSV